MPRVTLSASFNPETSEVKDLTPAQLYTALDGWISQRSRHGRGRTPEAAHFRSVANPQIKRLRAELRRRKLPTDSEVYYADHPRPSEEK